MNKPECYHCGDICEKDHLKIDNKSFCCNGCKTVYEIFATNDLTNYYDIQAAAGATPSSITGKYDFLDTASIVDKLTDFNDGNIQVINLFIPHIHCSSCIWILENLNKLNPSINESTVNFPQKKVSITYNSQELSLKKLVLLLAKIGYEPYISLDDFDTKKKKVDRSLLYKIGIAGFAFGNVMFLSFPDYLNLPSSTSSGGEFWLNEYNNLFRWIMFAFSLPVLLYSSKDYFISAYKGLRSKLLNIDVPISLGILVLFIRSTIEIIFDWGNGFFDSFNGLIFFLLIGKFFQQKTYAFLSFERDYKSYFPIAVTKILASGEEIYTQVHEIKKGDRLLIRNAELIPFDGILISGKAQIDYSFVTGESEPMRKAIGDKVFAGGKQQNGAIEIEALNSVSQSYLTQLWSNSIFQEDKSSDFQSLTDSIGKRFTFSIISIALLATIFWFFKDASKAMNVFTAVLIIACPCAIALASPFTLGNLLRIFGRKKFYLKDTLSIEKLAQIDTAIFDKTGTITTSKRNTATYNGLPMTSKEQLLLKNTLRASNHPLSRILYDIIETFKIVNLDSYKEYIGKGITGSIGTDHITIGSLNFVTNEVSTNTQNTAVHIRINEEYKGYYIFNNHYRNGVTDLFQAMSKSMRLAILSGDNAGEKENLEKLLPTKTPLYFNQKPQDKLEFIKRLQDNGDKVLMVGDGLNDAGALAQAEVGISISENINIFSPACDGILDATKFEQLNTYILASRKAMKIIKISFVLSLIYNVIGLYYAVTGQLQPIVAAILMPLSSISVVIFTSVATNIIGKNVK